MKKIFLSTLVLVSLLVSGACSTSQIDTVASIANAALSAFEGLLPTISQLQTKSGGTALTNAEITEITTYVNTAGTVFNKVIAEINTGDSGLSQAIVDINGLESTYSTLGLNGKVSNNVQLILNATNQVLSALVNAIYATKAANNPVSAHALVTTGTTSNIKLAGFGYMAKLKYKHRADKLEHATVTK